IDLNFIGHEYSDDPSKFVAMFNDKVEITGYLRKGEPLFATIRVGEFTASYSQHLRGLDLPEVFVMPQVTPIARNERLLDAGYVKRNQYNPVSRLHFRNQIHYLSEYFGRFKENAESTWPKLRILEFRREIDELQLLVQEEVFASEAGSMGSGLQVWLQMMWFLSKVSSNSVIALDEPDVYLHADLQRKLVSLLRDHQGQVLVATVSRSCRNAERTRSR
ncbi:MAG TPA: AAA family ATPase, partial [Fimbriimonadaceae bacterium]|nr:AAA family ATPase [Fimbriimonadaceae bacterium]